MSLKNSQAVLLSEFDLWSEPPTQVCVERGYLTEHRPNSILSINAPLEFCIPTSQDEYIFLTETTFSLKMSVSLITDAVPSDNIWDQVFPVNNLLNSMISSLNITINGKEIIRSQQNYAYKSYIETILGFSRNAKNTHLRTAMHFDGFDARNNGRNRAFTPIQSGVNSRTIDMIGKLHFDLGQQERALLGGSEMRFSIRFNKPSFYLMNSLQESVKTNVNLHEAFLSVYRFKVTQTLLTHHHRLLNSSPAVYPLTRSEVRSFSVGVGSYEANFDNVYIGQLPRRIFVFMVDTLAYNGSFEHDPFRFKHCNVNHMAVYLDGVQFPSRPFTPNFKNQEFSREYYSLFQALDQNGHDSILPLSKQQFILDFPVFAFNFAPDLSNGFGSFGYLSTLKRGCLRLEMKFADALTESINVMIYSEFDNVIEIDKDLNVTTDFN